MCSLCQHLSSGGTWAFDDLDELKEAATACSCCKVVHAACVSVITSNMLKLDTNNRLHIKNHETGGLMLSHNSPNPNKVGSIKDANPGQYWQVYTTQGIRSDCPFVRHGGHSHSNSGSDESFQAIENWLRECLNKHALCGKSTVNERLPTRVIDVGDDSREPSLYETLNHNYDGARPIYATLSHCWGNYQPIKTTQSNLNEMKTAIPFSALTQTFQDAVIICRRLSIQFLWIDSLCIVQDNEQDWAIESSEMATIYGNADFTIAAVSAPDGAHGCFMPSVKAIPIIIEDQDHLQTQLFVRECPQLFSFHGYLEEARRWSYDKALCLKPPLFTRGWTFQERYLSRRVIYYTAGDISWQCNTVTRCACRGITKQEPWLGIESVLSNTSSLAKVQQEWQKVVRLYSSGELSFDKDRLPALSGIASKFAPRLGTYLAGLWSTELPSSLLWTDDSRNNPEFEGTRRVSGVPTWSWMSITGGGASTQWHEQLQPIHCKVVEALTCPSTANLYGEVSRGHITLRCRMLPVSYEPEVTYLTGTHGCILLHDFMGMPAGVREHSNFWSGPWPRLEDDAIAKDETLYCALIQGTAELGFAALVLRSTKPMKRSEDPKGFGKNEFDIPNKASSYSRVGVQRWFCSQDKFSTPARLAREAFADVYQLFMKQEESNVIII